MPTVTKKDLQAIDELSRNPLALSKTLFDSTLWDKQEEIIRSVWENPRTAVKSCNSGGKSRIAAEIVLLYLLSFRPSRVITTAPTFLQVEDILWKEIAGLYHKSKYKLGGQLNRTSLEFGEIGGKPWDAMGISTNEVNRFQGFKSPHLLVILDEALGVAPEIWEAMEGLQPHRILAIGNPLDPSGNFFDCFSSSLWHKITINAWDAVEWQKKHGDIPGLVKESWIRERMEEWGKGSTLYQARVLGEFPEEGEGTLISRAWVDQARHRVNDGSDGRTPDLEEDAVRITSTDIASKHGHNETVISYRYGDTLKEIKGYKQISMVEARDKIKWLHSSKSTHQNVVDADGLGEGLPEMLALERVPVTEFRGGYGHKAIDSNRFKNLRSQFLWIVAKKFEKGYYSLNQIPQKEYEILKNQLCSVKQKPPDAFGRIQVETKEDMAARQVKSPDYADSFVMSEFGHWLHKYADMGPVAYR